MAPAQQLEFALNAVMLLLISSEEKSEPLWNPATAVVVSPPPPSILVSSSAATNNSPLLALPAEIQRIIYRKLTHRGELNFLRTCSCIYRLAIWHVSTHGIYRIRSQPCSVFLCAHQPFRIPTRIAAMTQYIDIKTTIEDWHCSANTELQLLRHLLHSGVPRKRCQVILETTVSTFAVEYWRSPLDLLKQAKNLEILMIRPFILGPVTKLSESRWRDPFEENLKNPYNLVKNTFEGSIGYGEWQKDSLGSFLEFHPRLYQERLQRRARETLDRTLAVRTRVQQMLTRGG